ncbi:MAG: hypothetical protein JWM75_333 [Sphingomonas bacterium]|nr:hypothetical protein [Sphingomonas bacterium]
MVAARSRPQCWEQLELRIDDPMPSPLPPPPSPPPLARPTLVAAARVDPVAVEPPSGLAEAPSFGHWLIAQKARGDWIDDLAAAARRDPAFPRAGSADAVRAHLSRAGAEGDMFEAVDDAERHWLKRVRG